MRRTRETLPRQSKLRLYQSMCDRQLSCESRSCNCPFSCSCSTCSGGRDCGDPDSFQAVNSLVRLDRSENAQAPLVSDLSIGQRFRGYGGGTKRRKFAKKLFPVRSVGVVWLVVSEETPNRGNRAVGLISMHLNVDRAGSIL